MSGQQQSQWLGQSVRYAGRALTWTDALIARHLQNVLTALIQIWENKWRSFLTTLGIIIAVTSTIAVVSLVQGFGDYVSGMLRGFGTNLIFVIPHRPPGPQGRGLRATMDVNDVRAVVGQCDKVRRISPMIWLGGTFEYGRQKVEAGQIELSGATEQFQAIRNFEVEKGRFFSPIEVDRGAYVCVLGRDVLRLLECDERIVGDYLYINQLRFQVVGLLEAKGSMMGEAQDRLALVPFTTAIKMSPMSGRFMAFIAAATSEEDIEECALQMTRVLRERHQLLPGQPNDFRLLRQDQFLRDFEKIKMIATGILAGIVGISLIVGGIGIMNVMLVSVTERTHEIGLRKSVGGRRRDILFQFLTEAAILSTLGGLIGIGLGLTLCRLASLHPSMVAVTVPIWIVALALGFSASVGILFGLIPAFKAAILHPIDALRHE